MNILYYFSSSYFISVFFELFKKINSTLCLTLFIYLFIFHMLDWCYMITLDYDIISTIILPFSKIFVYFFPFERVLLVFFLREKSYNNLLFFPFFFLFWIVILLSFINFLDTFLGVFDCILFLVSLLVLFWFWYNKN